MSLPCNIAMAAISSAGEVGAFNFEGRKQRIRTNILKAAAEIGKGMK